MKYNSMSKEDFVQLVQSEILTSSEALELLEVTKQNLNSLVKRGKITPVKVVKRDKLFLKEDILKRKEESAALKEKYRPYD